MPTYNKDIPFKLIEETTFRNDKDEVLTESYFTDILVGETIEQIECNLYDIMIEDCRDTFRKRVSGLVTSDEERDKIVDYICYNLRLRMSFEPKHGRHIVLGNASNMVELTK